MVNDKSSAFNVAKEDVRHLLEQIGQPLPSKAQSLVEESLAQMEINQESLSQTLGFTPEIIEIIYQHGYHLARSGKYTEAAPVFNLLRFLNSDEPRFIFATAANHHYAKNYLEAAAYYILYGAKDLQNPIPYFHLYDCFKKSGYPSVAQNALKEALRLAKLNPKYQKLKEEIQLEIDQIDSSKNKS